LTFTATHWFRPKIRQCKAISSRKAGPLSSEINLAMADFCEIPKGRDEFCAQRAQLPFRSGDRCSQFNTLVAKFASRQYAAVNVNSP
jgi:hypothetical protein